MKKIISYTALVFAGIMLTGTTALAANALSSQTAAGDTVSLADSGSGPGMSYNPSPSNLVVVASITNAYAITAMNTSAADNDRNEYGVFSGNTGYYQNVNGSTATPPVFGVVLSTSTNLSSDPFTSWTNMGGGGS